MEKEAKKGSAYQKARAASLDWRHNARMAISDAGRSSRQHVYIASESPRLVAGYLATIAKTHGLSVMSLLNMSDWALPTTEAPLLFDVAACTLADAFYIPTASTLSRHIELIRNCSSATSDGLLPKQPMLRTNDAFSIPISPSLIDEGRGRSSLRRRAYHHIALIAAACPCHRRATAHMPITLLPAAILPPTHVPSAHAHSPYTSGAALVCASLASSPGWRRLAR